MARPKSENPKDIVVRVRMDKEEHEKLEAFCEQMELNKTDAIKLALNKLYDAINYELHYKRK